VKGVRVRVGNIQVGDHTLLEEIFPEARFNSWSIGEVHIVDKRIIPNGRRDGFEANTHYRNLINHLAPVGRDIARKCRASSSRRSKLREFESAENDVGERLAIVSQRALSEAALTTVLAGADLSLARMAKIAALDFWGVTRPAMLQRVEALEEQVRAAAEGKPQTGALSALPPDKRFAYEEAFALIYECSSNRSAAKALIDRMIGKLATAPI
jgi:molecular chaperone HtpG